MGGWGFEEVESGGIKEIRVEVFFDVGASREVGFARGLEACDPSPREGVRGGVKVEEVILKEFGSELPRKLFDMDPVGGKPHASVVVEISSGGEFLGEVVHDGDGAAALLYRY